MGDYRSLSDAEIIRGIACRSDDAFRALYHAHTGQLTRFVQNNNGSQQDAQDIEQKAIIVLYEKVIQGNFSLSSKLSTFLFGVGKNLWYKELNKRSKSQAHKVSIEPVYEEISFSMDTEDDDEAILIKYFRQLGDSCRRILRGKYYDKLSDKELSSAIGTITEDNIRKRRYKCLQQLKKMFTTNLSHG